jgi:hypothetical protein
LNSSEADGKLFKRLHSLTSSLEQVVYNRDRIFEIVREAFHERNPLILKTLLDLVVQLAPDLQGDLYLHYKQSLFEDIVNLLLHSKQEQNEINTQLLEQVFQCSTYLFKYLRHIMLKDLGSLYVLCSKFLFSSSMRDTSTTKYEYSRSLAAESFAYLLHEIEIYQPSIDCLFDWKECNENELESLTLAFSETCKETCQHIEWTFHPCSKSLVLCLLKKLIAKPALMQPCIKTIYSLLIEHTNQQNGTILCTCFTNEYRVVGNEEKNPVVYNDRSMNSISITDQASNDHQCETVLRISDQSPKQG